MGIFSRLFKSGHESGENAPEADEHKAPEGPAASANPPAAEPPPSDQKTERGDRVLQPTTDGGGSTPPPRAANGRAAPTRTAPASASIAPRVPISPSAGSRPSPIPRIAPERLSMPSLAAHLMPEEAKTSVPPVTRAAAALPARPMGAPPPRPLGTAVKRTGAAAPAVVSSPLPAVVSSSPPPPAPVVSSSPPPAPVVSSSPPPAAVEAESTREVLTIIEDQSGGTREGVSTEQDLAAVRLVFSELAAIHVAHVCEVMLELRFGAVAPSLVESCLPALRSLRSMAAQMELGDLCVALDDFCSAVERATKGARTQVDRERKDDLLHRYERLIQLVPKAFELDAERDRREPIIVESLLRQVEGVEKLIIDKLFAVGLSGLETLLCASGEEIAVVAGIRRDLADRIVDHFRTYRADADGAVSAPDAKAVHRELRARVAALREQQQQFEHAAAGWSEEARAQKRRAQKVRERAFLGIRVALARLGEREHIDRLQRLPYRDRIQAIEAYLEQMANARPAPSSPPVRSAIAADHRAATKT